MLCASICYAQSNIVYYGTSSNALDVVFVDTNLSQKVQSAIVSDLNLCLSEWGKTAELILWDNDDDDDDDEGFVGDLDIATVSPHYPEDIDFPRHIVSNGTHGVALQIPKELSDAYTNAFAFAAANAFVAFISSTNFPNIPSKDLPNYLMDKNETPKEIAARAQAIISQLGRQTYYQPSVLGIERLPLGPKGIFSRSNLWMIVPCSSTRSNSDKKSWSAFHAMWHKGKWKFCHWPEEYED